MSGVLVVLLPVLDGMVENLTSVDSALPFGLRSTPKVFNVVADGLKWVI